MCFLFFRLLVNCSSLFPYLEIKSITESNLTVSDNEIVKPAHHSPDVGSMIKQKRSVDFDQNKGINKKFSRVNYIYIFICYILIVITLKEINVYHCSYRYSFV